MMAALTRQVSMGAVALLAFAGVIYSAGLRVNMTASLPLGIYWRTDDPIGRGSYVIFCPPTDNVVFHLARERHYIEYGNCTGRFGTLMKRVAALPGDQIDVDADGVRVNGTRVPNSTPRTTDRGGQPLPIVRLHTTVPPDDLLLMSDYTPWSFDARYFGPVARTAVRAQVKPVWTW